MYIAHRRDDGTIQPLYDHLTNVAELSEGFASALGLGDIGYHVGLAHDIGKYSDAFQRHINGSQEHIDHSTAGAIENSWFAPAAFCIAGHHGGIPDGGSYVDGPDDATLQGRLKRSEKDGTLDDYSAFHKEIELVKDKDKYVGQLMRFNSSNFDLALSVRFLFSCLVDADYLDTEEFMQGGAVVRGGYDALAELAPKLDEYIEAKGWNRPKSKLNEMRWHVAQECKQAGEGECNLLQVTVPTGGGKTIATLVLAFARIQRVERLIREGLCSRQPIQRVIIVIPYISIIEQTAKLLRKIFGIKNVVEHHSNMDSTTEPDDGFSATHKLSTENWDAPIIVTTNVQFFESLMSNKPSHCRKLHNIANSIIIFDEAQMLPLNYLVPCTRIIEALVREWGVTGVLCTATQPSLEKFFSGAVNIQEACADIPGLFRFFRRNKFERIQVNERIDASALAERDRSVLIISNSRRGAREVFAALPEKDRYHLSTLMYPCHRRRVLENIRAMLDEVNRFPNSDLACRVSSTSLVEAGADLDFDHVIREQAGLDSIIQAAGRCNREMRKNADESMVTVFSCAGSYPPDIGRRIEVANEVLRKGYPRPDSPECIRDYFDTLHCLDGDYLDKKKIVESFDKKNTWPFKTVAKEFELIESFTKTVIVPLEKEAEDLCDALERGHQNRETMRSVQQYAVSVRPNEYNGMCRCGAVAAIGEDYGILRDLLLYDEETGLNVNGREGEAIML